MSRGFQFGFSRAANGSCCCVGVRDWSPGWSLTAIWWSLVPFYHTAVETSRKSSSATPAASPSSFTTWNLIPPTLRKKRYQGIRSQELVKVCQEKIAHFYYTKSEWNNILLLYDRFYESWKDMMNITPSCCHQEAQEKNCPRSWWNIMKVSLSLIPNFVLDMILWIEFSRL